MREMAESVRTCMTRALSVKTASGTSADTTLVTLRESSLSFTAGFISS